MKLKDLKFIDNQKPTVLITGASAGLGLAIAKLLNSKNEFHLILTAREKSLARFQKEGLKESANLWIRPLEVTSQKEREILMQEILSNFPQLDFLINNAGVAYRTVSEHIEPTDLIKQMDINCYSPLSLSRLALPAMRKNKKGHIINISSVSGMMAMPTMGLYSASKFALEGLTESLWHEVKPWNIKVSLIQPGFIRSKAFSKVPWTRRAHIVNKNTQCPYHQHYNSMSTFIEKIMSRVLAKPESVAKKIYKVMLQKKPPLRKTVTIDATLFTLMKRVLPSRFYLWFLHKSLPNIKNWGTSDLEESVFSNFLNVHKEESISLDKSLNQNTNSL